MDTNPRDFDALLAQAGWAKALARHLVRDPDRADDLVQRAWLAALRRPPVDGTPPRRWLATVMRNFVRQDARESSRREQREHAVARADHMPSADAIDDAAALQVRLIAAVNELPEPSRSTVWARYYDGLAPREIAARDGVPVDTVKTRLARGLDALRKRFDREHGGDRRAWVSALLPLTASPALTVSAIGVVLMGLKWELAAALVVACTAAVWVVVESDEPGPPPVLAEVPIGVAMDLAQVAQPTPDLEVASEHAERAPIAVVPEDDSDDREVAQVHGRVLDLEGHPVEGLDVGPARQEFRWARSAADGSFAMRRDLAGQALEARGEGWATVWVDRIPPAGSTRSVTILVARAGGLSGTVLDDEGRPVEDAVIDIHIDDAMCRTLAGWIEADPHSIDYSAVSDANGRFDLGVVPLVAGTIRGDVDGRETRSVPIPRAARDDLVLALDPPAADRIVVRGSVGSAPSMLIHGAYVRIGSATQRTVRDGTFRLVVAPSDLLDDPIELIAVSENQCPTKITFASIGELASRAATETFDIVLGDDPLAITGRVVDWDGNPVAGATVRASEERFGTVTVKTLRQPERHERTVEAILRGDRGPDVESQPGDGAFAIHGLQTRDYRIEIRSRELLAMSVLEQVPAGTEELVVVLDTRGPKHRVAGRVVDGTGRPLAAVKVMAVVDVGFVGEPIASDFVTTNEAGEFVLDGLRGRTVQVSANFGTHAAVVDVNRDTKLDDVRIVVPRQFAIQVDLTSRPGFATDFQVLSAKGTVAMRSSRTVAAETVSLSSERTAVRLPIFDGLSDVVTVDEGDLTVVLLRDGQEVGRAPIVFASEGLTVIRP